MAILRTYQCDECDEYFDSWDVDPPCPHCPLEPVSQQPGDRHLAAASTHWVPAGGHIKSMATASIDNTATSLMAEHGMTDMRDNQREGDVAYKLTDSQNKMIESQGGSIFKPAGDLQQTLSGYNLGSSAERRAPMEALHRAIKSNKR